MKYDEDISRLSRLTAILTMLLSRKLVTSGQIAERFHVSSRTIFRDLRTLSDAGVPIYSVPGKGYRIMDDYKLPPVMFTEKEAFALITANQIIARSKDSSLKDEFEKAIAKIQSILKHSSQEKVELMEKQLYISKNYEDKTSSSSLIDIQMALTHRNVIELQYQKEDGSVSDRVIEPYAIYNNVEEEWVLIAYCRLRKDFRSFRLDRMKSIRILDEQFEPHKLTMKQYLDKYVGSSK